MVLLLSAFFPRAVLSSLSCLKRHGELRSYSWWRRLTWSRYLTPAVVVGEDRVCKGPCAVPWGAGMCFKPPTPTRRAHATQRQRAAHDGQGSMDSDTDPTPGLKNSGSENRIISPFGSGPGPISPPSRSSPKTARAKTNLIKCKVPWKTARAYTGRPIGYDVRPTCKFPASR